MKNKYALIGLLIALSAVTVPIISATIPGVILPTNYGQKWEVRILVNGHDVDQDTVKAEYALIIPGTTEYEWFEIPISAFRPTKTGFILNFHQKDLPGSAAATRVTGNLVSGADFDAGGIGFLWRRWGG